MQTGTLYQSDSDLRHVGWLLTPGLAETFVLSASGEVKGVATRESELNENDSVLTSQQPTTDVRSRTVMRPPLSSLEMVAAPSSAIIRAGFHRTRFSTCLLHRPSCTSWLY